MCENCNNEEFWHLCKNSVWFTLFFIPIFPYENEKLLVCPVCKAAVKVPTDEFEQLKPVAEANLALADGKITEVEHQMTLQRLSGPKLE